MDLVDDLSNPEKTVEEKNQAIDMAVIVKKRLEFCQNYLMEHFPPYDSRTEPKPKILPDDCWWWNGVDKFSVDDISPDRYIVTAFSYVGGGERDSRTVTIILPEELR